MTLYEPRGRFQLTIEGMRQAGLGPLYERFLRLKQKLEREGRVSRHNQGYDEAADGAVRTPKIDRVVDEVD